MTQASITAPLDPASCLEHGMATYPYDAASQIASDGYEYDVRGRLTAAPGHSYTWDSASRLIGSLLKELSVIFWFGGFQWRMPGLDAKLEKESYRDTFRRNNTCEDTNPFAEDPREGVETSNSWKISEAEGRLKEAEARLAEVETNYTSPWEGRSKISGEEWEIEGLRYENKVMKARMAVHEARMVYEAYKGD